jgi:hypothetical protein
MRNVSNWKYYQPEYYSAIFSLPVAVSEEKKQSLDYFVYALSTVWIKKPYDVSKSASVVM